MKSIVLLLAIFLMTNLEVKAFCSLPKHLNSKYLQPSNAAASYEMVYKADRLIESISCHLQELFNNGMRKLQNKQKEVQSAIAHKHLDDNQLYELNKKFSVEAASRCLREAIAIPQTKSLELIKRIAVGTVSLG